MQVLKNKQVRKWLASRGVDYCKKQQYRIELFDDYFILKEREKPSLRIWSWCCYVLLFVPLCFVYGVLEMIDEAKDAKNEWREEKVTNKEKVQSLKDFVKE